MADTKHTKWNEEQQVYEPSVVYNIKTGERYEGHPIDCKELVAGGEYSFEPQKSSPEALDSATPEPVKRDDLYPLAPNVVLPNPDAPGAGTVAGQRAEKEAEEKAAAAKHPAKKK